MCFSTPKQKEIPAPVIQPVPIPSASETESSVADKKRKQIAAYQSGLASTIKTSGQGVTGPVNLMAPAATEGKKKTLGGA